MLPHEETTLDEHGVGDDKNLFKGKDLLFTYDVGDEPEEEDDEMREDVDDDESGEEEDDILIVEGEDDMYEPDSPGMRQTKTQD